MIQESGSWNQEAAVTPATLQLPLDDAQEAGRWTLDASVAGKPHIPWTMLARRRAAKRSRQVVTTSHLPSRPYKNASVLLADPSLQESLGTWFSVFILSHC